MAYIPTEFARINEQIEIEIRGKRFPAVIENCTAHRGRQFDHPTLGSWVTYGLGSANQNLPAFVNIGRPSSPIQLTGGYLGAGVAATPFQAGDTPIHTSPKCPGTIV